MLAEFLKALVEQSRKGLIPDVRTVSDTDDRVLVTHANGDKEWVDTLPPAVISQVVTLDDLVRLALDPARSPAPEVWVLFNGVCLIHDQRTRRSYTTLPLRKTERWEQLEDLDDFDAMLSQKEAIAMLRRMFAFGEETAIVSALKRIEFNRTSSGVATVDRGRESLGMSVEAQVRSSITPPPDDFIVSVRPWRTPGLWDIDVKVPMLLELHAEKPAIEIRPQPDALDEVKGQALLDLRLRLEERVNPEGQQRKIDVHQGQATVRVGRSSVYVTF